MAFEKLSLRQSARPQIGEEHVQKLLYTMHHAIPPLHRAGWSPIYATIQERWLRQFCDSAQFPVNRMSGLQCRFPLLPRLNRRGTRSDNLDGWI